MGTELDIRAGLLDHNTAFNIMFEDAYANAVPGPYEAWTERIDTGGEQRVTLAWLANTPNWRQWAGAKQYKELRTYTLTVDYLKYESTLALKRDMVDYDKSGVVGRTIQRFINANVVDGFDQFISTALDGNSGAGPTGFDAVALYSASHPHGPAAATQSNLLAATNLSHANLVTAEQTGMLWVEENSRPVRASFNVMRVGPKLKRRAQELLSADRIATINDNGVQDQNRVLGSETFSVNAAANRSSVWKGDMDLVVDPRVTNFYWDLHDTSKGYKPMILFVTRAPEPIALTDMTDPERFEHDNYIYSVECDVGTAAGHWYATLRGTGTA